MSTARFDPRDPLVMHIARTVRETRRDAHDYWTHAAAEADDEQRLRSTLAPAEAQSDSSSDAVAQRWIYRVCGLGVVVAVLMGLFR